MLCGLYIQDFADEIVCLLSQIWIWGFWSVPFTIEEKVCFCLMMVAETCVRYLGSYCSMHVRHGLQYTMLTKLINSTE